MEKISLNMYVTAAGESIYTMRELSDFEMGLSALQYPTTQEAQEANELGEMLDQYAEWLLSMVPVNSPREVTDAVRFEAAIQVLALKLGFNTKPKGPIEQRFESEGFDLDEMTEDTSEEDAYYDAMYEAMKDRDDYNEKRDWLPF